MTHDEFLIRKAEEAIREDGRIPVDLHYRMLGAGLDSATIERQIKNRIEKE